jgi:capsular polysaccharide biosynthesis protein
MVMGWYAPMVPVHADSLRWCGVLPEKILVSRNSPIHARRAIFPTPICDPPWVLAPYAIRYLEGLAARVQAAHPDKVAAAGERVYLSRNRFGRRVLRNEEEVVAFLATRGYRVFYPEAMSFTDQVLALSRATHVVANMGAALTNAVFAPRGVRVLALATEDMPDDFFWDVTAQKGGMYFSLHGRATERDKGMQADFSIGLDRLRDVYALFDPG